MKLHVNFPGYAKGTELEVMGVGQVKNGDVLELTDVQVNTLKDQGFDVPDSGDMYVYNEATVPNTLTKPTTNLPGIEKVAEKERASKSKPNPKPEDK